MPIADTTRAPRPGEVAGVDYHYVDWAVMRAMVKNNEMLEYATFSGNMYGTSRAAVDAAVRTGKSCLLDVELQGVKTLRGMANLAAVFVLVRPPSLDALQTRLRLRGTEPLAVIEQRIQQARIDLDESKQRLKIQIEIAVDRSKTRLFDHEIVNDDVDAAYERLVKILQTSK